MHSAPLRWMEFQFRSACRSVYEVIRDHGWRELLAEAPAFSDRAAGGLEWLWTVTRAPALDSSIDASVGVVLLSYERQANIEMIVRAVLCCDFVDRIVVCNNNPAVRLSDWLTITDPKMTIIEQQLPTRQGVRLELLAKLDTDIAVSLDDDRFLFPWQLCELVQKTLERPESPHGFEGERARLDGPGAPPPQFVVHEGYPFEVAVRGIDTELDSLTGGAVLTRKQATRSVQLARALGIDDLARFGNGEDIIMSYAGDAPARIHDIGKLLECWTTNHEHVATWRKGHFFAERQRLRERLVEHLRAERRHAGQGQRV